MDVRTAIDETKKYIYKSYESTQEKIGPNIYRGHLRALSTEIEDAIALFVTNVLPNCKAFLDPSIYLDGTNNRPDLLIVNEYDDVIAMIEIKSNMGWCRNAKSVIDNIMNNDLKFRNVGKLKCEFSREESQTIYYGEKVKLFLIAFTDGNCSTKNHIANKEYAKTTKVQQFNLFSGWYGKLENCEIREFAEELLK